MRRFAAQHAPRAHATAPLHPPSPRCCLSLCPPPTCRASICPHCRCAGGGGAARRPVRLLPLLLPGPGLWLPPAGRCGRSARPILCPATATRAAATGTALPCTLACARGCKHAKPFKHASSASSGIICRCCCWCAGATLARCRAAANGRKSRPATTATAAAAAGDSAGAAAAASAGCAALGGVPAGGSGGSGGGPAAVAARQAAAGQPVAQPSRRADQAALLAASLCAVPQGVPCQVP